MALCITGCRLLWLPAFLTNINYIMTFLCILVGKLSDFLLSSLVDSNWQWVSCCHIRVSSLPDSNALSFIYKLQNVSFFYFCFWSLADRNGLSLHCRMWVALLVFIYIMLILYSLGIQCKCCNCTWLRALAKSPGVNLNVLLETSKLIVSLSC